jgi:hypothetical protein
MPLGVEPSAGSQPPPEQFLIIITHSHTHTLITLITTHVHTIAVVITTLTTIL